MRKKMLMVTAALVVFAAPVLGGATPATAHEGEHTSCAGGMTLVVDSGGIWPVSGPGLGPLGSDMKALAWLQAIGVLYPGQAPAMAHDQFCTPS